MPLYEFETVRGKKRVEAYYPMSNAPAIGEVVRIEGRICRRIPSGQRVTCFDPSHVAYNFPKRDARSLEEQPMVKDYPHVDADGYAAFSSAREIREFQAKHPRYAYDAR